MLTSRRGSPAPLRLNRDRCGPPRWVGMVSELVLAMSALAFYCAARLYAGLKVPVVAMIVASAVAVAWPVAHVYRLFNVPPIALGMGLIFILVGQTFWQEGRKQEARADVLLALTFVGWGLLSIAGAFRSRWTILRGVDLLPLMILPELFTCVLMVMSVYEEERRRVERNMLALSNLNLATSGFVGGEIQSMLGQALERVLGVVRIPAGALCLQHGEASGPSSVIVTGMSDSFCSSMQENGLHQYFINLVARLGGLVVFRDLTRDANWEALEKEESFRQVRQLLLAQGLRTVVGICLQANPEIRGGTARACATHDFISGSQCDSCAGRAGKVLGALRDSTDGGFEIEFRGVDVDFFSGMHGAKAGNGMGRIGHAKLTAKGNRGQASVMIGNVQDLRIGHSTQQVAHQAIEFRIGDEMSGLLAAKRSTKDTGQAQQLGIAAGQAMRPVASTDQFALDAECG